MLFSKDKHRRKLKCLLLGLVLESILFIDSSSTFAATVDASKTTDETEWNLALLVQACPNIASTRICDPDHVLSSAIVNTATNATADHEDISSATSTDDAGTIYNTTKEIAVEETDGNDDAINASSISAALYELETNHPLQCKWSTSTNTAGNTIDNTPVQMAVVVVNRIDMKGKNYFDDNFKINQAKELAMELHNAWGVGSTECGGSGILLLVSIKDRVVYISISDGLKNILTWNRIESIVEDDMKPFLREEEYSQAIVNSIFAIMRYLDQGPPSFIEQYLGYIILGTVALGMLGADKWNKKKKMEYVRVKSHLNQMDRERAMALMGKFECTSCPICLEDFVVVHPGNDPSSVDHDSHDHNKNEDKNIKDKDKDRTDGNYMGSDGKPLQLLRCGHAFDKTCWEAWTSKHSRNIHQCPICKQDIGSNVHSASQHVDTASYSSSNRLAETRPLVSFLMNPHSNSINANAMATDVHQDSYHHIRRHTPYIRSRFTTQQQQQIYESERIFRIHRLRNRYPYYIQPSHVESWTRNDYVGNMAQDPDFIRRDPNVVSQGYKSTAGSSSSGVGGGSHSFGSFGGGHSGGGGGGTW